MASQIPARTALFYRHQPGGVNAVEDSSLSTGSRFFVSSATGTDAAGYGFSPDAPFATINYAMSASNAQIAANNGDIVYAMPNHSETITAAGGITYATAGVRVIGLGIGRQRPTIKFSTANTGTVAASAANCSLENCVVDCTGFAAVVAPVKITAADFSVLGCEFIVNNATNQAVSAITTTSAANRLTVKNCQFRGTSDAGVTAAIIIVGGDGHIVESNTFIGGYSSGVGAIQNVTTACTNTRIWGNQIQNLTATCTKAMVFAAGSTGQISENVMQILSGTAPITGAAMSWVGANYYAATIATAGTLI